MPILASTAYNTAEDVLNRVRTILNDSEVAGGDIITDTAPFSFDLINSGFERVQAELAAYGDETFNIEAWLVGLPIMPIVDPAGRMIIDDTGTNIIYPGNSPNNSFSQTPQLPTDLIVPLKLWERQTATTNFPDKMKQPNGGLINMEQQLFLVDWEWKTDGLRFRGALQSQDIRILYRKHLPKLAAPTDPVPIRGVLNAAAFHSAKIFADSRGGSITPSAKMTADEEMMLMKIELVRRRSRKQVRRRPYSGRGGRNYPYL